MKAHEINERSDDESEEEEDEEEKDEPPQSSTADLGTTAIPNETSLTDEEAIRIVS